VTGTLKPLVATQAVLISIWNLIFYRKKHIDADMFSKSHPWNRVVFLWISVAKLLDIRKEKTETCPLN
jgi:hypothetical protein